MCHRVFAVCLLFLTLCGTASAADASPKPLPEFIAAEAERRGFDGNILVRDAQGERYAGRFGEADRAFGVPHARDTRYWIASVTKLFTATLVLQLAADGTLDLHAPIRRYLPDYAGSGGDSITLHHLLNHTAGLPQYMAQEEADAIAHGMAVYQLPHTLDELVAKYCSGSPKTKPGEVFDYNNADYVLLGAIIERAAGQSFETVLRERILVPLRLANTGMLRQADIVPKLARSYFGGDASRNDLPVYPENWGASGAMYSTVDDLATFADALFGGRLLDAASLERLLAPGLDEYGYGVWSYRMTVDGKSVRVAKRTGRIMGAQAQLFRVIDGDVAIVLLANSDAADTDEFVAAIAREVIRKPR